MQILPLIDFSKEQKEEVSSIISHMLLEKNFIASNFSSQCIDSKLVLKILISVVNVVDIENGLEIVRQIISSKFFFEYYNNVGHIFSIFIKSMLKKHCKTQKAICDFIDKYKEPKEKIKLLLLFIRIITNKNLKLQYKQFLMENINQIEENDLIFFSINNWVDIPEEKIKEYFADIIKLDKSQNKVILIPDPYESKIEIICLLYLMGKVDDLSGLRNLSKKPSYLEFLIDKDDFDYSKVDFDHYMWGNIIRNEEYRKLLIDNKSAFVGVLKDKYLTKIITEDEKKILYKYFLDEHELWSI